MPTLIHQRVRGAQRGENPSVICRPPSGWVVVGDQQPVPGYTLLLSDPVRPDLNSLSMAERRATGPWVYFPPRPQVPFDSVRERPLMEEIARAIKQSAGSGP